MKSKWNRRGRSRAARRCRWREPVPFVAALPIGPWRSPGKPSEFVSLLPNRKFPAARDKRLVEAVCCRRIPLLKVVAAGVESTGSQFIVIRQQFGTTPHQLCCIVAVVKTLVGLRSMPCGAVLLPGSCRYSLLNRPGYVPTPPRPPAYQPFAIRTGLVVFLRRVPLRPCLGALLLLGPLLRRP